MFFAWLFVGLLTALWAVGRLIIMMSNSQEIVSWAEANDVGLTILVSMFVPCLLIATFIQMIGA